MHERYSGPLKYRITVIGNQTFSGLYSIAWSPRRVQGNAVVISELQKYAYESKAIALPENGCYLLHDARKQYFYREVDDTDDIDMRPHLVCFVHLTAVSPLKEGITIRIRVASCLADGSEGAGTFQVALPRLLTTPPGITNEPTGSTDTLLQRLTGAPLVPLVIRPLQEKVRTFKCVLEGNIFQQKVPAMGDYVLTEWPKTDSVNIIYESPTTYDFFTRTCLLAHKAGEFSEISPYWIAYVSFDRVTDMDDIAPVIASMYEAFKDLVNKEALASEFVEAFVKKLDVPTSTKVWQYTRGIMPGQGADFPIFQAGEEIKLHVKEGEPKAEYTIYTKNGPILLLTVDLDGKVATPTPSLQRLSTKKFSEYINTATQITNLNLVDESMGMPAGWMNCIFTADRPKPVNAPIRSFININHVSLKSLIEFIAPNIRVTECLQFTLADLDSGGTIMVCRYLGDRECVVCNVGTGLDNDVYYYVCNRALSSMYISSIAIVPRVNTFPVTDLRSFVSNTITGRGTYNAGGPEEVIPNSGLGMAIAAIGGGMLGGIGQGISAAVTNQWKGGQNEKDRELAKYLQMYQSGQMTAAQERQFEFLLKQGKANFGYNAELQARQFDFQREMAGGQWAQQGRLQANEFAQENAMQHQDFVNSRENAIQQQELAGYRTKSQAYSGTNPGGPGEPEPGGSDTRSSTPLPDFNFIHPPDSTAPPKQPPTPPPDYDASFGAAYNDNLRGLPNFDELKRSLESSNREGREFLAQRGINIDHESIAPSDRSDTISQYSTASSGAGSYSSASSGISGPRESAMNDTFLHGPAYPKGKNTSFLHSNPYAKQRRTVPSTSSPMKSGRPNTIRVGGARPAWRGGNTIKIRS